MVAIFYPRRAGPAIVSLPISKRDSAPSVIKGLIPLCEFRFRRGPDRRRWGPHHDVQFRRLTRVLAQIEKGYHFASESHIRRLAERRCHNKKRRRHRLEKSPVPRKGPRSTPPGPVGACISENARASSNSSLHGRRRISGSRRQTKPFAARWGRS